MYTKDQQIQQTKNWVERVVVGFNFCPFAKREVLRDSIRYTVIQEEEVEVFLLALTEELKQLDDQPSIETTLMIFPNGLDNFEDYLDVVAMGQVLLEDLGYEGLYQLASFHPAYCFGGTTTEDASNFTNRSPYPMIHLIREESIERALEHYEDPDAIPERNIAFAEEKGTAVLKEILSNCYKI